MFIDAGLSHYNVTHVPKRISILEIGFGTGLNALLSFLYANNQEIYISYTGIEPHPLDWSLVEQLGYPEFLRQEGHASDFQKMHSEEFADPISLSPHFNIVKHPRLTDHAPGMAYQVVYYDAFAPQAQPEMWSLEAMKSISEQLVSGGILVTYCAQGQFQRNLKAAGFSVERLPGPPGKREMVRATLIGTDGV